MTNEKGRLVSEREACKILDCRPNTLAVWRATKRYDLPFYKIGRLVKYKISDLEAFIQESRKGSKGV
jgi:hypothetical protein